MTFSRDDDDFDRALAWKEREREERRTMLTKFVCEVCGGEWLIGMRAPALSEMPRNDWPSGLADCPYCPEQREPAAGARAEERQEP